MTTRRQVFLGLPAVASRGQWLAPIELDARRELFAGDSPIDWMRGAELRLGTPVERAIVLRMDRPHEGAFSGYFTVLRDEGKYRLYYRGAPDAGQDGRPPETTRYAEPADGARFTKPANNIVLQGQPPYSHNLSPLIDPNPWSGSRYKALSGIASSGLRAWVSDDGLAWRPLRDEPTRRTWRSGRRARAVMSPMRGSSGTGSGRLRARRAMWGERRTTVSTRTRSTRISAPPIFMWASRRGSIRGGATVSRYFRESFLRPGLGLHRWVSRDNYPALNVVETGEGEMGFYVQRHYGQPTAHLQRFPLRTGGFASLHAGWRGACGWRR